MDWRLMFKGDYIQAVEFGDSKPTFKISEVRLCKLEGEDGRTKDKGVVFFEGKDRGWVLCKTNAICLAAMFGPDTSTWSGKRVTLYSAMVQVGKSKQPGIRVRGSPDIKESMQVEIKLPRKKPTMVTMQATGEQRNGPAPTASNTTALWKETKARLGAEKAKEAWDAAAEQCADGKPSKEWTEAELLSVGEFLSSWSPALDAPPDKAPEPKVDPPKPVEPSSDNRSRNARIAKIREEAKERHGELFADAWADACRECANGKPSTQWSEKEILAVTDYLSRWRVLPVEDTTGVDPEAAAILTGEREPGSDDD